MCRINRLKSPYGLFIFICAMCLLSVFSSVAAGASLADLAGTWNFNSFVTGPGAPWWMQLTLKIKSDGTFTGSGIASDPGDNSPNVSGSFSLTSGGFLMNIGDPNCLCQIDLGQTVMACTVTWPRKAGSAAGSTDLIVGTKQAASYSNDDLVADDWEVNMLDGGPTNPSWMQISGDAIDSNGNLQGSYSDSSGGAANVAGQVALSANGEVTCVSGNCPDLNYNADFVSYMDASKTIIVGTYGVSATNPDAVNPDAVLTVFTKMAPSYSMSDLAGAWEGNILASGPDAPWWQRLSGTIKADGTSTISSTQNSGKTRKYTGLTWSISDDGVVTLSENLYQDGKMVMNSDKTVMVATGSWGDGSTIIGIFIKTAALPGAPTGVSATPGNAQAKVNFTSAPANGSSITTYTVTSSPDAAHPNGVTAKGNKLPITVKPLINGQPYTFTVTATNGVGTGPASNPASNSVQPGTKPAAPTIGVIAVDVGQATVNFTEKSDGGSPTTYTVTWNPKGGGVDTNAGTNSLSHLVTGLTSGKKYTFTVTATNAFGSSSSTSKQVTIK
ncbi:MAG: fibronectin type III domain-containing protein [Syntrophobacteraceae bacterium]